MRVFCVHSLVGEVYRGMCTGRGAAAGSDLNSQDLTPDTVFTREAVKWLWHDPETLRPIRTYRRAHANVPIQSFAHSNATEGRGCSRTTKDVEEGGGGR